MMTLWHKTFHTLVFGAVVVLAIAAFAIRSRQKEQLALLRQAAPMNTLAPGPKNSALPVVLEGGATPEETLLSFIAALEAEDVQRASRHFVAERQYEWQDVLAAVKNGGGLPAMAQELENARTEWQKESESPTEAVYSAKDKKIIFEKEPAGDLWSIREL